MLQATARTLRVGQYSSRKDMGFSRWQPSGQLLAWSNADDHSIDVVEYGSGNRIQRFAGHTESVVKMAFSQNGKYFASASDDRTMRIWDMKSGKVIEVLSLPKAEVKELLFLSDDERLVGSFENLGITVWESPAKRNSSVQAARRRRRGVRKAIDGSDRCRSEQIEDRRMNSFLC